VKNKLGSIKMHGTNVKKKSLNNLVAQKENILESSSNSIHLKIGRDKE